MTQIPFKFYLQASLKSLAFFSKKIVLKFFRRVKLVKT